MTDSITDAAAHLSGLLLTKEKELKEKEVDFDRRVQLFETENPSAGNDADVIRLNVGGAANISVLRGTLTQFEGSMLAASFSGRWDDSLKKDEDGRFFIDQDAGNFKALVDFLRLRNNRSLSGDIPTRHRPKPTYEFCWMLEYYGLMPCVYPQAWIGNGSFFSSREKSYNTLELASKNSDAGASPFTVTVLHGRMEAYQSVGVSEFTVEFEKGTAGSVGWLDCDKDNIKDTVNASHTFDKSRENSIFLNIGQRKIFGPQNMLEEYMRIDHLESATKVTCRYDGCGEYSIAAEDGSPPHGAGAKLETARSVRVKVSNSFTSATHRVYPFISFCGKVTVSDFKYEIDKL